MWTIFRFRITSHKAHIALHIANLLLCCLPITPRRNHGSDYLWICNELRSCWFMLACGLSSTFQDQPFRSSHKTWWRCFPATNNYRLIVYEAVAPAEHVPHIVPGINHRLVASRLRLRRRHHTWRAHPFMRISWDRSANQTLALAAVC